MAALLMGAAARPFGGELLGCPPRPLNELATCSGRCCGGCRSRRPNVEHLDDCGLAEEGLAHPLRVDLLAPAPCITTSGNAWPAMVIENSSEGPTHDCSMTRPAAAFCRPTGMRGLNWLAAGTSCPGDGDFIPEQSRNPAQGYFFHQPGARPSVPKRIQLCGPPASRERRS